MTTPNYISGIVWSAVNAAATVLVPFGIFIFFARIAGPHVVGLVALAVACSDVLKTLGMQGIYEALLPYGVADRRHHETAAMILLCGGLGVMLVYGGVLAGLEHFVPGMRGHLLALAFVGLRIPLDLLTLQPQAVLAQSLAYRRLALRSLVASIIAGLMGGLVSLFVAPLYGLIAYQVLLSALLLLITAFGTGLLARPRLHRDCYADMSREGWWSTSVRFVAANVVNLDQIIVASIAGSVPLAYFNVGKRIETSFVSVANSFVSVSFQPLFARFATVPPAEVMQRSLAVLALVCAVPAACLLADGPVLVRLIFGPQWMPAVAIAQVLAVSGAVRAIGCVPGALLSVSGRNRELFGIAVASAVATAAAAVLLTPFGIVWCAVGLLIKNALSVVWLAAGQRDMVPRAWRVYVGSALVPFALVVAGAVGVVQLAAHVGGVTAAVPRLAALAMGSLCGGALSVVYLAATRQLDPRRLFAMMRGSLGGTDRVPVAETVAPPVG